MEFFGIEISIHILALFIAVLADKLFGDPQWLPHPIVLFGKAISFFDKNLNHGKHRILKGALLNITLIIVVGVFFFLLTYITYKLNIWLGLFTEALFIFYGIAGKTLITEGKQVFIKLNESLNAGRKQVARIVGRDTSELSANEIKAATLETLAENLSDGVVAPLFWYCIAGIPGIMVYKLANTFDSMIGYKNAKYLKFGRFPAKLDDVLNFIPARLTALLMVIVNLNSKAFIFIFKYGRAHSSPNAGYPESALSGIINAQFGGAHNYFGKKVVKPTIGENRRNFTFSDLKRTNYTNIAVELLFIILITIISFYIKIPQFN